MVKFINRHVRKSVEEYKRYQNSFVWGPMTSYIIGTIRKFLIPFLNIDIDKPPVSEGKMAEIAKDCVNDLVLRSGLNEVPKACSERHQTSLNILAEAYVGTVTYICSRLTKLVPVIITKADDDSLEIISEVMLDLK
jgi:hypothetical protein